MEVANQASSAATEKTEESLLPRAAVEGSSDEGSSHIGASALRVVMHIMPNTINGDTESESEYIFYGQSSLSMAESTCLLHKVRLHEHQISNTDSNLDHNPEVV